MARETLGRSPLRKPIRSSRLTRHRHHDQLHATSHPSPFLPAQQLSRAARIIDPQHHPLALVGTECTESEAQCRIDRLWWSWGC